MGRYASQADIVPSLIVESVAAQITRDDPAAATIDTAVFATHIEEAEAEVDAYLGARFALPLDTVPVLVRRLSARIARYRLYASRPGEVEAGVRADYDAAVRMLERIAEGRLEIGLASGGEAVATSSPGGGRVRTGSRPPVFGRSNQDH